MKTHINNKDLPQNYTYEDWIKAGRPSVWEILKEKRIQVNKNDYIKLIIAGDQGYGKIRIFLFKNGSPTHKKKRKSVCVPIRVLW